MDRLMPTLLDWLLKRYPDTPKKRAKQWILTGRVSVNGVVLHRPQQVIPDPRDALELVDRRATALDCGPGGWRIHPRVALLCLDAALAVVNKGTGLISVPAKPGDLSALSILADFLAGKIRTTHFVPAAYRRLKPLPVHRLDQYTSGVFCLAMNPTARQALIEQLSARRIRREYIAFVEGRPRSPKGTWRNWLRLSNDELRQFVVSKSDAGATEAVTHYEVIEEFPAAGVTKLRLRLETGRKHQIRAQAAHAGLPLVGDRTYNPNGRINFPRQALHAEVLSLEHPEQPGKRMTWTTALPQDLQQLEATVRSVRR